jgi:hypothetical protein
MKDNGLLQVKAQTLLLAEHLIRANPPNPAFGDPAIHLFAVDAASTATACP